jgi:hypothetical protein
VRTSYTGSELLDNLYKLDQDRGAERHTRIELMDSLLRLIRTKEQENKLKLVYWIACIRVEVWENVKHSSVFNLLRNDVELHWLAELMCRP